MKRVFSVLMAVAFSITIFAQQNPREGFQQYQLANGMKVYLWVDKNWTDVYGRVAVRVGAIDEPADFTGLAHYLEHVIFKGTQQIGALDWEKEKPIYEEIIRLFDECAAEKDVKKKEALVKQINEKSIEAGKVSRDDEFSVLTQGIGGYELNAYTAQDQTAYHSAFPTHQMEKWLTINCDRFINPVFRSFQAELENVVEEFNRSEDMMGTHQSRVILENAFKGTPYAREIIGSIEHLKNPALSPVIKYFNDWYVPNNMALILVGNFDPETAKPLIEKTFGKMEAKPLPERIPVNPQPFTAGQTVKSKLGYAYQPEIYWFFDGIKSGHPDKLKLEFVLNCLNNNQETGLFDKLNLENTVGSVYAGLWEAREMGRIYIGASPRMDLSNGTFATDKQTEKDVMAEINKLKKGNIPSWLFQSVKEQLLQEIKIEQEGTGYKVDLLTEIFINQGNIENYFNLEEKVKAITIDDVKDIAAKYFDANYLTISFSEGDPKIKKLKKRDVKPLTDRPGTDSDYGKYLNSLPEGEMLVYFNDVNDVKHKELYPNVDLFYTENPQNDIFSLLLEYGVGTHKMPNLLYAAYLMNGAGTMPNQKAQDFKRELGRFGATCTFYPGVDNFYIQVVGEEKNLQKIMEIVTRLTLMPKLDNDQIEQILWSAVVSRMSEQKASGTLTNALWNYIQYGNKSPYIDRIPSKELIKIGMTGESWSINPLISNTELTKTVQEATSYAVKMYYVGQKSIEDVSKILSETSPVKKDMLAKVPEYFRPRVEYKTPQIYFLPNSELQQSAVYMYIPIGDDFQKSKLAKQAAFNEYFSGGFAGLVMNEIREKRSMAYTAYGVATGSLKSKKEYFYGYVGTQHDKVLDVIDTYVDLIKNMPQYPERITNVKNQLKAVLLGNKWHFRSKPQIVESNKEVGFDDDPAKYLLPQFENMTFEDIVKFYNETIKDKPLIIVIHGDPKLVKTKEIQKKYGKITTLSKSKLFKGGEFWF